MTPVWWIGIIMSQVLMKNEVRITNESKCMRWFAKKFWNMIWNRAPSFTLLT